MKKPLLIVVLLFVSLLPVVADKPRIAVIPFDSIGLSKANVHSLSLLFETALLNTNKFDVIEQTRVEPLLRALEYSLNDCTDEECAIEIGKLLSAEQIVLGTVGIIGQRYYLNVKIIDVQLGRNLGAQKDYADSLEALIELIDPLAFGLAGMSPPKRSGTRQGTTQTEQAKSGAVTVAHIYGSAKLEIRLAGDLYVDGEHKTIVAQPSTVSIERIESGPHIFEMRYKSGETEIVRKEIYDLIPNTVSFRSPKIYSNGKYIGQFEGYTEHGKGTYYWDNGQSEEQEWKNGKKKSKWFWF